MDIFSRKKVRTHRVGKTKAYFVSGPSHKIDKFMVDRVFEQKAPALLLKVLDFVAPTKKEAKKFKKTIKAKMYLESSPGGTYSKGKAYIRLGTKEVPTREILRHELFHLKPIVGQSEALAHLWGGLHSKKGKLDFGAAKKSYRYAWELRPNRMKLEHGLAGVAVLGAGLAIRSYKKKKKQSMLKIAEDYMHASGSSYKGTDHRNDTVLYPQHTGAGELPTTITPGSLLRLSRVKAQIANLGIKNRSERSIPVAGADNRTTQALDGVVSELQQALI
jgi:hypothetical protein